MKRLEDYGWSFRWLWVTHVVYFVVGVALGLVIAFGPLRAQLAGIVAAVLWFGFMGFVMLPSDRDTRR